VEAYAFLMKTFLTVFSLLGLAGLLSLTGCASDTEHGGSYGSMESSHDQYTSPQNTPDGNDPGDYWARDYKH